jgi:hypothetical protein
MLPRQSVSQQTGREADLKMKTRHQLGALADGGSKKLLAF